MHNILSGDQKEQTAQDDLSDTLEPATRIPAHDRGVKAYPTSSIPSNNNMQMIIKINS